MAYRQTRKYKQQRLGPRGGRTPRDPADEAAPLPELRIRITVERFDFGEERHVFELWRTRRVDTYEIFVDGKPWKNAGITDALVGLRKALPRVMSARSAA